jgi:hypothetical protein
MMSINCTWLTQNNLLSAVCSKIEMNGDRFNLFRPSVSIEKGDTDKPFDLYLHIHSASLDKIPVFS